jgi:2-phospho-L-lactate guanylyltransferase
VKPSIWAVVPAKSLSEGKSRLRPLLDEAARARLAQELLEHVLDTLRACDLEGVLVATDGDDVASVALSRGATVLRDRESGSLARVVDLALAEVTSLGATIGVVLMADLPHIEPRDVRELIATLTGHDVALVRDRLGHHTNALAITLPPAIATRFGRDDSFAAHLLAAEAAGLSVGIVANERIAFDVDLPTDHAALTTPRPAIGT